MKNISIVVFAMLIVAILPMPYGYYTLLRLTVFAYFCFVISKLYSGKFSPLEIECILLIILYNPIIKIYLPKEVWICINLITASIIPFIVKKTK